MQRKALLLLHPNFEEIEAVTPIDLLRRAQIEVTVASLDTIEVKGHSGITIRADKILDFSDCHAFDALIIPGGPGVRAMRQNERVIDLIQDYFNQKKLIAAICAAPLLLHDAHLLDGKSYTAHFSTASELPDALQEAVVEEDRLITSSGPGTAIPFSLAIIKYLAGKSKADAIASGIVYPCT